MGTRVDFYVGRGESAEWLGSYPFDGYPAGVFDEAPELFVEPPTMEVEWRTWVDRWLREQDRATLPEHGWPWPWNTSATTDYAYGRSSCVVRLSPPWHSVTCGSSPCRCPFCTGPTGDGSSEYVR